MVPLEGIRARSSPFCDILSGVDVANAVPYMRRRDYWNLVSIYSQLPIDCLSGVVVLKSPEPPCLSQSLLTKSPHNA